MSALRGFLDSMAGRIFILLVAGVSVSVAFSLALADIRQDAAIDRSRMDVLVMRVKYMVELSNAVPTRDRDRIIEEGLPGLRIAPTWLKEGPVDDELTERLKAELPDYAQPTARGIDAQLCQTLPGVTGSGDDPAAPVASRFTDLDCWLVTSKTANGGVLRLRLHLPHQADTSPFQDPVPLGISFLAFSLIAFMVARMAAKPLNQLASAAISLGDDLDRSPILERGPSEVRWAARAFNAMQEVLKRQMKERRQMLGAITHDLQTPLTRLRLRIEKVDDENLRSRLIGDLAQMQSLIREGLELARGDECVETPAVLDVDAMLLSLAEDAAVAGKPVAFTGGCGCDLTAKPQALRRAVANLLDNAIKYAGSAELQAIARPEGLVIYVRDRGPGLPEERLRDVLEPFVRLEDSRSRETGGAGLGLTIAHMLARKTDAVLNLRNRPGGGLEVSITFPPGAMTLRPQPARRVAREFRPERSRSRVARARALPPRTYEKT